MNQNRDGLCKIMLILGICSGAGLAMGESQREEGMLDRPEFAPIRYQVKLITDEGTVIGRAVCEIASTGDSAELEVDDCQIHEM